MARTEPRGGQIRDGTIKDIDVHASAAIAGTKISPDFGSQDINIASGKLYKIDGTQLALADLSDGSNSIQAWSYTVDESDFTAGATTESIELFSLPAGYMIQSIGLYHDEAFTGGGLSAFTVEVGIVGNTDSYAIAFDVFSSPGGTNFQLSHNPGMESATGATSIKITATSISANVSAATAGSVKVGVVVCKLF